MSDHLADSEVIGAGHDEAIRQSVPSDDDSEHSLFCDLTTVSANTRILDSFAKRTWSCRWFA